MPSKALGGEGVRPEDLERIRRVLEAAVSRLCPVWLARQREDIVQKAMMRIERILREGGEGAIRTSAYLWRVAHSVTVNEIRSVRRRGEVPIEEAGLEARPADEATSPERARQLSELGEAIRECLGRLVEPRRIAVVLHLHGYGLTESASLQSWTRKRTDNLLYRGLADLRRCLGERGFAP